MNIKNTQMNGNATYLNYVVSVLKFDVLSYLKELSNSIRDIQTAPAESHTNGADLKKIEMSGIKSSQAIRDCLALLMIVSNKEWNNELSLNKVLDSVVKSLYFDLQSDHLDISVSYNPPEKDILVFCDEPIIQSVTTNLFYLAKDQFSDPKVAFSVFYESGFATITLRYKGEKHKMMNPADKSENSAQAVSLTEFNNPYTILKHMEKLGLGVLFFSFNERYHIINFTLHLITRESEAPKPGKISSLQEHNWKDKTVLIVDDIEVNYFFLETILADTRVKTLYASNGKIAVDMCRQNNNIDAVLMDIKMPVMDGYEATKIIKEEKPELPVIIQTAYSFNEEYEKCRELGCSDYITKPLKSENVISVLAKYFID